MSPGACASLPNVETTAAPAAVARRSDTLKAVLFAFLAAHIVFPLLWIVVLAEAGPRENDWRHFQVAAEQFVAGNWSDIYSERLDSIHPGYFWRYPPYALYLVAPFAWMPSIAVYALLAAIAVSALVAAIAMLARLARPPDTPTWALAIGLSAPALTTLVTGQISSLLLLCVVVALLFWTQGRIVAACAMLGLMAIKPNLGIFFGFYVIARREWRGAAAMAATVLALCATAAPLGWDLWMDFVRVSMSNVNVIALYDPAKMITLKAFLATVLGDGQLAFWVWVVVSVTAVAAAVWAWQTPGSPLRHLGLVLLLAIAINPYAFFYDALLLAIPATAWWVERAQWRRRRWITVGALIAVAWCWEHYAHTWREVLNVFGLGFYPPFSAVGPIAAAWLLLAASEARNAQGDRGVQGERMAPDLRDLPVNASTQ